MRHVFFHVFLFLTLFPRSSYSLYLKKVSFDVLRMHQEAFPLSFFIISLPSDSRTKLDKERVAKEFSYLEKPNVPPLRSPRQQCNYLYFFADMAQTLLARCCPILFILKYLSAFTYLGIFNISKRESTCSPTPTHTCMCMLYYAFRHYVTPDQTQWIHVLQHYTPRFLIQHLEVSCFCNQNSLQLCFP